MIINHLPAIGQPWPGVDGIYAGVTTAKDGSLYALVLLNARPRGDLTWERAREWAGSLNAELPTRPDGALLFANVPDAFDARWHWLDEQSSPDYAWCQGFSGGYQNDGVKGGELRARAVRRFKLEQGDTHV